MTHLASRVGAAASRDDDDVAMVTRAEHALRAEKLSRKLHRFRGLCGDPKYEPTLVRYKRRTRLHDNRRVAPASDETSFSTKGDAALAAEDAAETRAVENRAAEMTMLGGAAETGATDAAAEMTAADVANESVIGNGTKPLRFVRFSVETDDREKHCAPPEDSDEEGGGSGERHGKRTTGGDGDGGTGTGPGGREVTARPRGAYPIKTRELTHVTEYTNKAFDAPLVGNG